MTPLLTHLPHDSTAIPFDVLPDYLISEAELRQELLRLIDWHTAALYAEGIGESDVLRADVSRLVVDVERFPDDRDEPCAAVGMGATYVRTCEGRPLRALSPERREELLARFYWPHHRRLEAVAESRLARLGRCVILDAHSFPTGALPTQVDFCAPPEIGLGTEGGHTPPALRTLAETFFLARGFVVGVDVPFRGAMVPTRHYRRDFRVQSLMVEIRRDLYMDEATGERHGGFARLQAVLADFRSELTRYAAT